MIKHTARFLKLEYKLQFKSCRKIYWNIYIPESPARNVGIPKYRWQHCYSVSVIVGLVVWIYHTNTWGAIWILAISLAEPSGRQQCVPISQDPWHFHFKWEVLCLNGRIGELLLYHSPKNFPRSVIKSLSLKLLFYFSNFSSPAFFSLQALE
jgi:hypothetical protein